MLEEIKRQLEKIASELTVFRMVNCIQTVIIICCLAFLIGKLFK